MNHDGDLFDERRKKDRRKNRVEVKNERRKEDRRKENIHLDFLNCHLDMVLLLFAQACNYNPLFHYIYNYILYILFFDYYPFLNLLFGI